MFKIVFRPRSRLTSVEPATREYITASEALAQLLGLLASDEQVIVYGPVGSEIGLEELRILAESEAQ